MKIQLIRNATLKINYSEKFFIIDPFLMPKHTIESFAGISLNPILDLPSTPEQVLEGISMVMVSHLHPDHFDPLVIQLLPNDTQIFCQPSDESLLRRAGFSSVKAIEASTEWNGINIIRTPGQHGTGIWAQQMGNVSGFVFQAKNEPTVYWAGDTILYEGVREVLVQIKPDIVITHSGGAKFPGSDPIIMNDEQTIALCKEAPQATIIATHMEALDHCTVSRKQLRELAEKSGIKSDKLLIPSDGQIISI